MEAFIGAVLLALALAGLRALYKFFERKIISLDKDEPDKALPSSVIKGLAFFGVIASYFILMRGCAFILDGK